MELLKFTSGKGLRFGDALHILANVVFVALLALIVFVGQLQLLALLLVLFSKWRIFAVRPRFWNINLRSNLLDLVFVVSVISLAIHPMAGAIAQATWLFIFAAWQIVVKQLTSRTAMLVQAALGQLFGLMALLSYAAYFVPGSQLYLVTVVLGAWVIGYAAARHIMASYDNEPKTEFFALLWGFIVAEVVWLLGHWLHVYTIMAGIEIPQVTLIVMLIGFCSQQIYSLQRYILEHDDQYIRKKSTQNELRKAYIAGAFSLSLVVVVLVTTSWTITI